jgi:Outer membrane lipoprotein-sorting protein
MRLSFTAFAAILILVPTSHAADTKAILARPQQSLQSADFRAAGHLVRVDSAGKRTSYAITLKGHWFPGVMRILCEIAAPAPVHILLEMRAGGQDTIEVAHPGDKTPKTLPFDQWSDGPLGPGFSYEDFLEPQYFWPNQTVVEQTRYGARDCDVLKSSPGPADRTHYAEVRSWLDRKIGFPVYAEKTFKGTGKVKEFTYFGLRQNGGVWSASQVEAKLRGQAGSTLLIIDRGDTKANLNLKAFSSEQIVHF